MEIKSDFDGIKNNLKKEINYMFKIICSTCGNEVNLIKLIGEECTYDEEEGWYVTEEKLSKFNIYAEHDQIWIECRNCNTKVWMFT